MEHINKSPLSSFFSRLKNRKGTRLSPLKKIFLIFIALLIITPLIPLVIWSFAGSWVYPGLFPDYLTFDNYNLLFNKYKLINVIYESIKLSLIVTLIALILGIAPAKYIGTHNFRGKTAAQVLSMLPFMAPGVVILFGLLPIYAKLGIYMTYLSLVMTEVVFVTPYMIMVLVPIFKNYDSGIEDQAATLGVSPLSRLLNITFPCIKSGLAVACMYAFMSSWSMYLAVSMYAPAGFDTLATMLYPAIATDFFGNGFTAALTIIYFLPSIIFLLLTTWIMGTDNVNNRRV